MEAEVEVVIFSLKAAKTRARYRDYRRLARSPFFDVQPVFDGTKLCLHVGQSTRPKTLLFRSSPSIPRCTGRTRERETASDWPRPEVRLRYPWPRYGCSRTADSQKAQANADQVKVPCGTIQVAPG